MTNIIDLRSFYRYYTKINFRMKDEFDTVHDGNVLSYHVIRKYLRMMMERLHVINTIKGTNYELIKSFLEYIFFVIIFWFVLNTNYMQYYNDFDKKWFIRLVKNSDVSWSYQSRSCQKDDFNIFHQTYSSNFHNLISVKRSVTYIFYQNYVIFSVSKN